MFAPFLSGLMVTEKTSNQKKDECEPSEGGVSSSTESEDEALPSFGATLGSSSSPGANASSSTITIPKSEYDTLNKKALEWSRLKKEFQELWEKNAKDCKDYNEIQSKLEDYDRVMTKQLQIHKEQKQDIQELHSLIEELRGALRDAGKSAKIEQRKPVTEKIHKYNRVVGYRTTKFPRDKTLAKYCYKVYEAIKEDMGFVPGDGEDEDDIEDTKLSYSEFQRIYSGFISKNMGSRRQYDQSGGMKACVGK